MNLGGESEINPNTGQRYLIDPIQRESDAMRIDDFNEYCEVCGLRITTMIFRQSGVCGERCRKKRAGERDEEQALAP